MLLTKECDYGLRIVRALAGGEKKTVEAICDIEHIPDQYAYKILKKMERAGIVQSSRGRNGGYQLVKSPHAFTLHDVISAVDDNLFVFECLREDNSCLHNDPKRPCVVHLEFERLQKLLVNEMRKKTMKEILS